MRRCLEIKLSRADGEALVGARLKIFREVCGVARREWRALPADAGREETVRS